MLTNRTSPLSLIDSIRSQRAAHDEMIQHNPCRDFWESGPPLMTLGEYLEFRRMLATCERVIGGDVEPISEVWVAEPPADREISLVGEYRRRGYGKEEPWNEVTIGEHSALYLPVGID